MISKMNVAVLLSLPCIFSFCSNQKNAVPIVWKETIGILDPRGYKEGTIYYKANGEVYHTKFSTIISHGIWNEKYSMRYNINDPNEVQIDYWNLFFEAGEKTVLYPARIKTIQKKTFLSPRAAVIYTFEIDNKKNEAWVYLPQDYEKRYPYLKEGQYYQLECWEENTARNVLHLDKLINSGK